MGSIGTSRILTQQDVKGARFVLKTSQNPAEIARAQQILKQYKEQNKEGRR